MVWHYQTLIADTTELHFFMSSKEEVEKNRNRKIEKKCFYLEYTK